MGCLLDAVDCWLLHSGSASLIGAHLLSVLDLILYSFLLLVLKDNFIFFVFRTVIFI